MIMWVGRQTIMHAISGLHLHWSSCGCYRNVRHCEGASMVTSRSKTPRIIFWLHVLQSLPHYDMTVATDSNTHTEQHNLYFFEKQTSYPFGNHHQLLSLSVKFRKELKSNLHVFFLKQILNKVTLIDNFYYF